MNTRIRELRNELKLNQTEFGKRLGVKQTTIAGYETGAKNPMDAIINSICREFDVNEEWLRTGHGDMFKESLEEDELTKYLGEITAGKHNPLRTAILKYGRLSHDSKKVINAALDIILSTEKTGED